MRRYFPWLGIGAVFGLLVAFLAQTPWLKIHYHEWRMRRAWDAAYSRPKIENGLVGFEMGSDFADYEYHRGQLVTLGAARELNYTFKHLQVPTPESSHLIQSLLQGECPPSILWESDHPDEPRALAITVWCYAKDVEDWNSYLQARDMEDYREKIAVPDVSKKSDE